MADRLISLAAGVLPEFAPEQMAAAAVAAGWPAVGIWVDPTTWTAATAREVRARVADAGIAVLDVEVIWLKPGGDDADHFRIVDAGAAIRARNVLAVSSETDPGAAAARLARLADHAEAAGLRLSLEFAAFTEVKSLAEARAILDRAGDGVGLMVDPLHLARTGGTPAMLATVDPRRFAYAQICDAPAASPAASDVAGIIHEALDLRLPVGEGALPLADLLATLPEATPVSVELRSKALRDAWPDATDRARALLASTGAGLAALDRAG